MVILGALGQQVCWGCRLLQRWASYSNAFAVVSVEIALYVAFEGLALVVVFVVVVVVAGQRTMQVSVVTVEASVGFPTTSSMVSMATAMVLSEIRRRFSPELQQVSRAVVLAVVIRVAGVEAGFLSHLLFGRSRLQLRRVD